MTGGPLRVEISGGDRSSATLHLTGDLAFETAAELLRAATGLLDEGRCRLRLDLSGLELCDSSGLSALIEIHHAARRAGGWMRPVRAPRNLTRLFERTGLDRFFLLGQPPVDDRATG
ncbi:STAS domain-containing protein [Plantactinospora siamensis]|uniref:STAS domain-containing protein n=1 Tax=Plantactinospora siamensis TaxID=555372 RepID=A0ABV6P2E3_9ACTN